MKSDDGWVWCYRIQRRDITRQTHCLATQKECLRTWGQVACFCERVGLWLLKPIAMHLGLLGTAPTKPAGETDTWR